MHCIEIGIVKATEEQVEKIRKMKIKMLETQAKGFYFVEASKGWKKKKISSTGVSHILEVETDYFGGIGDQSSKLIDIQMNWKERKRPVRFNSINKGLDALKVPKSDNENTDLFDVVGLGRLRNIKDFNELAK